MKENIPQLKWRCIGESVKGASHVRSGLPNQDAIRWFPESGIGLPLILAVSDGHGSAKSFRSDRGSRFAVETAIKVIQEFFLSSQSSDINFSALKDAAQRLLPPRLVNEWRKAVNKDLGLSENDEEKLTNKPNFTDEEKQILVDKDGEAAWQAVENNYFLAYGATVLAVLVTEFFIVYIQLGDGDILEVDSKGNTTRPLERDPNLIANETTSLCMNKAWNEFQVHIKLYPQGRPKEIPALILVSTDGYSNSFSTDEGFFKIGQDYRQMFKSNLTEEVRQKLEGFLQETSEKGSGDDITLGMIKRLEEDDRDYLTDCVEDLGRQVTVVKESSMRQQKDISGIESKVNDLKQQQYTTQKAVYWGFIWGFSLIIGTFLVSNAFSSYLFFRLNKVEKMLNELKEPKSGEKGQSQPLNSSSNTSSPPPETTPSQVPTPIPTQ